MVDLIASMREIEALRAKLAEAERKLAHTDPMNYAPRIKLPMLMIDGRLGE